MVFNYFVFVEGAGGSGKSTLFKQMKVIYGDQYSELERRQHLPIIYRYGTVRYGTRKWFFYMLLSFLKKNSFLLFSLQLYHFILFYSYFSISLFLSLPLYVYMPIYMSPLSPPLSNYLSFPHYLSVSHSNCLSLFLLCSSLSIFLSISPLCPHRLSHLIPSLNPSYLPSTPNTYVQQHFELYQTTSGPGN